MDRVRSYYSFGATQNGVMPLHPAIYEIEIGDHAEQLLKHVISKVIHRRFEYSPVLQKNKVMYTLRTQFGVVQRSIAAVSNDNYCQNLKDQIVVEWNQGASILWPIVVPSSSSSDSAMEEDDSDPSEVGSDSVGEFLDAILVACSPRSESSVDN